VAWDVERYKNEMVPRGGIEGYLSTLPETYIIYTFNPIIDIS